MKKRPKLPLLCFALLLFAVQASAQTLSLSLKNVTLEKAFREVEARVPQRFVYTRDMLDQSRPITVNISNASLQSALQQIFESQPLAFTIEDRFIKVRFRPTTSVSQATEIANEVKGVVTDEKGEPVAGATITIRGKGTGTATDARGGFRIKDVDEGAILQISSVGFVSTEAAASPGHSLTIALRPSVTALDETVVIAYGTTTRRLNTGNLSRVTAEQIARQPVSNPIAALQGRVPGLFITQQNGLPGSNFSVLIRGRNSLQNGTSPLFVVDGVPFLNDADRLTQRGGSLNANNPFNTINPLDIESIEILKDADATAIYGSRGANGVVLITTKRAKSGKTTVDASFVTGWGRITRTMAYLNTPQYIAMRREAFRNDGVTPTIANAYDLVAWDTTRYTNWKEILIGGTARTQNVSLRLSGGTAQTSFSLSAQHYRETTVFPSEDAIKRSSLALDLRHKSTDNKFQGVLSATFAKNNSNLPQTDPTSFITIAPNAPNLYDSLGRLNWRENNGAFSNPLAGVLQRHMSSSERLTADLNLSYNLSRHFRLKASVGYNSLHFDETTPRPIASQDPASNPKGSTAFGANAVSTWIIEPQAEYTSSVSKKGEVNVLVGLTQQETINKSTLIEGSGYADDRLLMSTAGAATLTAVNGYSQYRYEAAYSRINLRWDRKYLLNLTARRDGSSRFGTGQRFANFGAIGAGWIFSKEKALSTSTFLSYGKLRGSYGVTGNDQIGDYKYLDAYAALTYNYQGLPSLRPIQLFNADYSWERSKKLEAAIELGFWKDRLLLTTSWFRNRSDNQLIFYNLPTQTGFAGILRNFPGLVQNSGWEFELNATIVNGRRWRWTSNLNLTTSRNRLLAFPGLETSSYASTYAIGRPLNAFSGYTFLGIDPATGVYSFEDKNGDGAITPQAGSKLNDYSYLGSTDPRYYGGFQNEITFGNVSLSFLIQFVNQLGRHPVYASSTLYGAVNTNHPVAVLDHWTKPGDNAPYQRYSQRTSSNPALTANRQVTTSSAVLTDASYARLKNIHLQYSLPASWLGKLGIRDLMVYMQAQNLFTLTDFIGADPETGSRVSLPPLRMMTVGISVKF